MTVLDVCATWPVPSVAAAVLDHHAGSIVAIYGDPAQVYQLASLAKPMTAWAVLVAVEEGLIRLDDELDATFAGQAGCTLRHLLSHAGGYPFSGSTPIAAPARTRTYSNGGVELAARLVEMRSDMDFAEYLHLAVFQPLGMASSDLRGSPAHRVWSCVDDVVRFLAEVRSPTLVSVPTALDATSVQFPALGGIVPGVGRYAQCPWGLGFEIRGEKSPHWTGARNDAATYGHFGGAGTMMWTDPAAELSLVALTNRDFDEWADEALFSWPEVSDLVLDECGASPQRAVQ